MKKLLTLAIALLSLSAVAQTKKITASNPKFAIVHSEEEIDKVVAGKTTIYMLLYRFGDNSVISIDRATGKISTVIVGTDKVSRATIQDIALLPDGRLIFFSANEGVRVFDGKSIESSTLIWKPDAERGMVEASLAISPRGHILINSQDKGQVLLDPDFKQISQFSTVGRSYGVVDDNTNIWLSDMSNLIKLDSLGNVVAKFKTYTEPFKDIDEFNGIALSSDSMLYLLTKQQIYRTHSNAAKLDIVCKSPNPNVKFRAMHIAPTGQFYATSEDYENPGLFEYGKDLTSEPKGGKAIITGINDNYTTRPIEFKANQSKFVGDADGNMIVYSTYRVFIYHPSGIKGYTDLKNKYTIIK